MRASVGKSRAGLSRASQIEDRARRDLPRIVRAAKALGITRSLDVPSVRVVGARKMAQINARYRGKSLPTDVLSFPAPQPVRRATGFLGEILLCSEVLRRQARELGHSPEKELMVLLVHGYLHLLGYDHERSERERRKMSALEGRLMGQLRQSRGDTELAGLIQRA